MEMPGKRLRDILTMANSVAFVAQSRGISGEPAAQLVRVQLGAARVRERPGREASQALKHRLGSSEGCTLDLVLLSNLFLSEIKANLARPLCNTQSQVAHTHSHMHSS
jgi:hypothetical protein